MHPNAQLIERFYTAFQQGDAETMAACYAPDCRFSDPVFPLLQGDEATDMWRMLLGRAKDFSLHFDGVGANDRSGHAHWVATYDFSRTGRRVVNDIHAQFEFENGLIVRHRDYFDFWRWARQALGLKGVLLGWAPPVQRAVRNTAAASLAAYREHK